MAQLDSLFNMSTTDCNIVEKYSWILIWTLSGLVGLYFVTRIYKRRKFVWAFDKLPGPKPYPVFGNIIELGWCNASLSAKINGPTVFMDLRNGSCELHNKESLVRLWFAWEPVVLLFRADSVEPILTSNVSINKSNFYDLLEPWLGKGLLLRSGEKWRTRRKVLTPTFHFRILQDFLPVMNVHSANLVKKIRSNLKDDWIDVVPILTNCTLDIISETAMGFRLNCQDNTDAEYAKAVHDITFAISYRGTKVWLWNNFVFSLTKQGKRFKECLETINGLTLKVIKEKKNLLKTSSKGSSPLDGNTETDTMIQGKKRIAFLDLLLEKHQEDPEFTEKDIIDEVNTFMFGGHDTTATSLTWMLYLLGLHPEVQEKVYNEVIDVYGDNDSDVTMDQMRDLKYMDIVLKECQRLYPAVPGFARVAEEDIQIGKRTLPKGTAIFVNSYSLHRDPKVFPNPEVFDPERFSPENSKGRHPYAYVPFSAGPRNCIGQKYALMEIKVVLSHVLRNFKLTSLDPRDKILLSPEVVLRPLGPVRIKFEARRSS